MHHLLATIGHPVPRLLAPQEVKVMIPVVRMIANNKIFFMLPGFNLSIFIFADAKIMNL